MSHTIQDSNQNRHILDCSIDDLFRKVICADVACYREDVPGTCECFDFGGHGYEFCGIDITDDDFGTFLGEQECSATSDALASAWKFD